MANLTPSGWETDDNITAGEQARWARDANGALCMVDPDNEQQAAYVAQLVTDAAGNVSVTGDQSGIAINFDGMKQPGVSVSGVSNIGVLDQLANGTYVCIDTNNGDFGRRLFLYSGDVLAGNGTVTPLTATSLNAANALKDSAGNVVGHDTSKINNAWAVSNGDIFFLGWCNTNKYHLWRAKAGTYTVGSDAGYSNKQACISLGLNGGTQSLNIRSLSKRTFLEATVNGAKHYFLCEYNVNGSRTPGSGGAGGDQAIVYRSTDGGTTWTTFFEFNTGGSNVIAHFHGAIQDPYTGWIYFMTGDVGSGCNIIGYNGTAAAPAANTSLATIASTAGFKVFGGTEMARYTDLLFGEYGIYSMPDADLESNDPNTVAYVSTFLPRTLDYCGSRSPVTRTDSVPPILGLAGQNYALMVSFFSSGAGGGYHHIWSAMSKNGGWDLIAKIKNYNSGGTSVPANFFVDKLDASKIWLSFAYDQGGYVTSTTQNGSAVLLNLAPKTSVLTYAAP